MSVLPDEEWRILLRLSQSARVSQRANPRANQHAAGSGPAGADFRREFAAAAASLVHPLSVEVYAPLIARIAGGPLTLAQIGQSVDGRIATDTGHSRDINGAGGLDHLHRLRALMDVVVVGATTAVLDDPLLTTRRVAGPDPVRVVVDPRRRVAGTSRMFGDGADSYVIAARTSASVEAAPGPACIVLDGDADGQVPCAAILDTLHGRGLTAVLIEGGGVTISSFLRAGLLERLHVIIGPLLMGSGRSAFAWPAIESLDDAMRLAIRPYALGTDVLLDCEPAALPPA